MKTEVQDKAYHWKPHLVWEFYQIRCRQRSSILAPSSCWRRRWILMVPWTPSSPSPLFSSALTQAVWVAAAAASARMRSREAARSLVALPSIRAARVAPLPSLAARQCSRPPAVARTKATQPGLYLAQSRAAPLVVVVALWLGRGREAAALSCLGPSPTGDTIPQPRYTD